MQNIKIIFVDIDWTILDHEKHDFDYESITALNKARENGYLVFICTARPYDSVKKTGLLNHLNVNGLICTNGATGFINDELLFADNFPKEVVKSIVDTCNSHGLTLELSTEKERFFSREKNYFVEAFFASYDEKMPPIKENYDEENVSAILLFSDEQSDEMLKSELPEGVNIFRFAPCAADLNLIPSSKAKGIKRVLEKLNLKKEDAMGIGDDYGDIPMFESVGLAIAMENGVEEAKKSSHFVTKAVKESGVKHALEHFHII